MYVISRILIVTVSSVFLIGCSDDDPMPVRHYYNPTWSPDGKTVAAGFFDDPSGKDNGVSAGSQMIITDVETRQNKIVTFPNTKNRSRYWFDRAGSSLVFPVNGLTFYTLDGAVQGTHTLGGTPALSFASDSNAYLWATSESGRLKVGRVTYASNAWQPATQRLLLDTAITPQVRDITHTGSASYALLLTDGNVLEYTFNGARISSFTITPLAESEPWRHQLRYYAIGFTRRVYVHSDSGLTYLDLMTKTSKTIIYGTIVNFDVNDSIRFIMFETTSYHTWLAQPEGTPIQRIREGKTFLIMPRFSPNGKKMAAVAVMDQRRDSLFIDDLF